ncbi:Endonuclease 4 [Zea mays]|uniref:Aspergillus nuclease S1 n=2 Tax=Zea mays TaxID=4577 RepID=A0A3L6DSB3_MAIZE|nr:hypothetical protein Zm00014a_040142 [Zea mays]PWZ11496.1 Endonuclease 4 [Zea mays]
MAPHHQQRALLLFPLVFLLLLLAPPLAGAWGKEGHIMVCKIAEKYLSEKAAAAVKALLPESAGGELSTVCPWADQVRWHYHWASPLHYANTPQVCNFKYSRDCHNSRGQQGMCVVGAINNYTDQLYSYGQKTSYNLTESLMFLAHFVGDVHQPLHVGFEDDEGGNTITVHWYRRKANLHHVCACCTSSMLNFRCVLTSYAIESIHYSCNYAYKDVEQDITLGDDYFFSRYPIVEKRLAQAGIRLALVLNRIFGGGEADDIPLQVQ